MIPIDNQEIKKEIPEEEITPETEESAVESAVATENEETEEKNSGKLKGKDKKKKKDKDTQKEEIEKINQEYSLLNDKYLRLCAEYDNFRKRSQKEKDALYGDIKSNVLTSFLPVYDNLIRALDAKTEDEAYKKGVEMIMNQFNQTMEKLGVTEIPSLGEKFDPNLHNAVMHVDDETKGENEIVEVFQKGFMAGDKIIRPSMVKVAN